MKSLPSLLYPAHVVLQERVGLGGFGTAMVMPSDSHSSDLAPKNGKHPQGDTGHSAAKSPYAVSGVRTRSFTASYLPILQAQSLKFLQGLRRPTSQHLGDLRRIRSLDLPSQV